MEPDTPGAPDSTANVPEPLRNRQFSRQYHGYTWRNRLIKEWAYWEWAYGHGEDKNGVFGVWEIELGRFRQLVFDRTETLFLSHF